MRVKANFKNTPFAIGEGGTQRDYSSVIALFGHSPMQVPHSLQTDWSISYLAAPAEIASIGQASAQSPHEMQSSVITTAMNYTSLRCKIIVRLFSKDNFKNNVFEII
jgi:hypothetical protein